MKNLAVFAHFLVVVTAVPAPQATSSSTTSSTLLTSVCDGNTADDRTVWCDYSIETDWYDEVPNTGVIKEYWLEITNMTVSPDGFERVALGINNSIPGPLIEANWGDTLKLHVTNSLTANGTTMHWHGFRQNYTVQHDGVPSIIQCPDAPGTTHTYTFRATQYGTTWYHSHYALQAWMGVFGPMVIHGPTAANYDEELEPIMFNDWTHTSVDALWPSAQAGGPPQLDNALINGKGTFDGAGSRYEMSIEAGKKYKLRFINSAIDTYFKLSLDGHTMTVVAMDFVPVEPFEVDVLDFTMGQRYDVIIEANQSPDNYWFRAIPQSACSNNLNSNDVRAIVRYDTTSTVDPTTAAWNQTDSCDDVSASSLIPHVKHTVTSPVLQGPELGVSVARGSNNLFTWSIGLASMMVDWSAPSLLQIAEGNATWKSDENVYLLPNANEWVYWVIDTQLPVPHPIHLHGHDFYILAQEAGETIDSETTVLNLDNPPRRDVATLPASGYLVIAFLTDNPGAWLMHCHIGWHVAEGLALQFVERQSEIPALVDVDELQSTCRAWEDWQSDETTKIEQEDSGV
ncbi:extracellular dihydrogeodin oxidase/laccase [Setomelanomma holmii]|uniref:laccase n=1 Tax=Setomelanomma holmii TaxID=210430 RepID=A0A9P4LK37_9PLEO|nr:extracellular dihydrogeodin oxidase/laccase [Setomelanomma holmii]